MGELVTDLIDSFLQFFSFALFAQALSDPVNWAIIGSLVVLEGLLSADNALVLAIMVKHLPPEQQKKALFYGLIGAYAFRFVAIALGTVLIKIWWIKAVGSLYLLWMAGRYFFAPKKKEQQAETGKVKEKAAKMGFWRTVLAVETMDVAFSVDSVLAALGVSDQVWVLYIGGILGIIMMRGVAQVFIFLIDRYPELETAAYVLIAMIGGKMMLSAFAVHIGNLLFFTLMAVVFVGTFVIHYLRQQTE
ncbi:MAG: alx [Firmicutes bacterium]|nr:alx [Bacillota bacterium]